MINQETKNEMRIIEMPEELSELDYIIAKKEDIMIIVINTLLQDNTSLQEDAF